MLEVVPSCYGKYLLVEFSVCTEREGETAQDQSFQTWSPGSCLHVFPQYFDDSNGKNFENLFPELGVIYLKHQSASAVPLAKPRAESLRRSPPFFCFYFLKKRKKIQPYSTLNFLGTILVETIRSCKQTKLGYQGFLADEKSSLLGLILFERWTDRKCASPM